MKNIAICADGTGNSAVKGRGTNVFKLYEAVDQVGHRLTPGLKAQVALYHDGVGTESFKWIRLASGATGWGLSRNVKQLYGELARVYAPGDKLFLFGFSRGAFTVRTLAGLIHALEREAGTLRLGRWSYWLFAWGMFITAFFTIRSYVGVVLEGTITWRDVMRNVADTILSSQWLGLVLQTWWRHPWLVAWLALTLTLAVWVDRRLDRTYSRFWHADDMRRKLRNTLGLG
jgi:Uncharacterized alpha/beta hydrolase domain (DUF2235)